MSTHNSTPPSYSVSPVPLLTIQETAAFLKVTRSMVYQLERQGLIRPVLVGKRRRYRLVELERYLEAGGA